MQMQRDKTDFRMHKRAQVQPLCVFSPSNPAGFQPASTFPEVAIKTLFSSSSK